MDKITDKYLIFRVCHLLREKKTLYEKDIEKDWLDIFQNGALKKIDSLKEEAEDKAPMEATLDLTKKPGSLPGEEVIKKHIIENYKFLTTFYAHKNLAFVDIIIHFQVANMNLLECSYIILKCLEFAYDFRVLEKMEIPEKEEKLYISQQAKKVYRRIKDFPSPVEFKKEQKLTFPTLEELQHLSQNINTKTDELKKKYAVVHNTPPVKPKREKESFCSLC